MTSDTYVPVSCERHSEYELAIMHRQTLEISWHDEQNTLHQQVLVPYDVMTEQKAEYLLAKDTNGEDKKIRLDNITASRAIKD